MSIYACVIKKRRHPIGTELSSVQGRRISTLENMKTEYKEGLEVAKNFEKAMKVLFRSPKPEIPRKQPKATSGKRLKSDKD